VSLWLWGINNADQVGRLNSADASDIADGIMYHAQCAEHLVKCLLISGWLHESDGQYVIHDWDIWQSQWYKALEKREANAKRMREVRAQNPDCAENGASHSAEHSIPHVQASPSPNRNPTVTITQPEHRNVETNVSCRANPTSDAVEEVVLFLNLTLGTNYRPSSKKTVEHITARLREGFVLDDFKTVILKKKLEWGNDPQMSKFLRPETLFGTKFESYLNQPDIPPPQSTHNVLAELYHEAKGMELHDPQ